MTREAAYDKHIAPLMTQIIALCKEHGVPVFATFELDRQEGQADDDPLMCTTAIFDTADGKPLQCYGTRLRRAHAAVAPRPPISIAETRTTRPDGTEEIKIKLV